jgi:hypothetical protein
MALGPYGQQMNLGMGQSRGLGPTSRFNPRQPAVPMGTSRQFQPQPPRQMTLGGGRNFNPRAAQNPGMRLGMGMGFNPRQQGMMSAASSTGPGQYQQYTKQMPQFGNRFGQQGPVNTTMPVGTGMPSRESMAQVEQMLGGGGQRNYAGGTPGFDEGAYGRMTPMPQPAPMGLGPQEPTMQSMIQRKMMMNQPQQEPMY